MLHPCNGAEAERVDLGNGAFVQCSSMTDTAQSSRPSWRTSRGGGTWVLVARSNVDGRLAVDKWGNRRFTDEAPLGPQYGTGDLLELEGETRHLRISAGAERASRPRPTRRPVLARVRPKRKGRHHRPRGAESSGWTTGARGRPHPGPGARLGAGDPRDRGTASSLSAPCRPCVPRSHVRLDRGSNQMGGYADASARELTAALGRCLNK